MSILSVNDSELDTFLLPWKTIFPLCKELCLSEFCSLGTPIDSNDLVLVSFCFLSECLSKIVVWDFFYLGISYKTILFCLDYSLLCILGTHYLN